MGKLRRTKIIVTLGPASNTYSVIKALIEAGADAIRFNFSHVNYEEYRRLFGLVRQISSELGIPVTTIQDLQGPKFRVGILKTGEIVLNPGDKIVLTAGEENGNFPKAIPVDCPQLIRAMKEGARILMDDGAIELRVEKVEPEALLCQVIEGGILKSRKGINVPEIKFDLPPLTEKDIRDVLFGIELGFDAVCLSFVRSADDVKALKTLLREKSASKPVIAKIEKPQALEQIEDIVNASDAIMIARGDLGVEISTENVPVIQKKIIKLCNRIGKPVITATQMLESMIKEPYPTRAEASDVANAIFDGTDAVMLSGETAVGAYPLRAIETMAKIAIVAEEFATFNNYPPAGTSNIHALAEALNSMEKVISPKAIILFATDNKAPIIIASEKLRTPVIAFVTDDNTCHYLNLLWGIKPVYVQQLEKSFEAQVSFARKFVADRKLCRSGDKIIIVGSDKSSQQEAVDSLKIDVIE